MTGDPRLISPHVAELRELQKSILDDEVVKDLAAVMEASPYKFPGLAPIKNELTKRRFYTLAYFYARLLRLIELTHISGPTTKGYLIDADWCLRSLQMTSDKNEMRTLFHRVRADLRSAALSLP